MRVVAPAARGSDEQHERDGGMEAQQHRREGRRESMMETPYEQRASRCITMVPDVVFLGA